MELLQARWADGRFLCVGLDSDYHLIPAVLKRDGASIFKVITDFNLAIIMATKEYACAFKPNVAFYERHGDVGWLALKHTIAYILNFAPNIPVILDAKRADIGNTNAGYVRAAFDWLGADAITVHPYLGEEAMNPFLDLRDRGVIVLCRTSNTGAGEFQDLLVSAPGNMNQRVPLYQYVAHRVVTEWNENGNCALVVGATYPEELAKVRNIVGDMPILIPGIGAQGGDLKATVNAGMNSQGIGMIINNSRGIIFASLESDFEAAAAKAAQTMHLQISEFRMAKLFSEAVPVSV